MNDAFVISPALMERLRSRGTAASAHLALDAAIPDLTLVTTAAIDGTTYLSLTIEVTADAGLCLLRLGDPLGGLSSSGYAVGIIPRLAASVPAPNLSYPLALASAPVTWAIDGPGPGTAMAFAPGGGLSVVDYPIWEFEPADLWSIDVWLRTTQNPGAPADIINKSDGSTWPFRLRLLPGGFLDGSRSDGVDTVTVTTTEVVNDGDWHYVSLIRRASTLVIQVDDTTEVVAADPVTGSTNNVVVLVVATSAVDIEMADFGSYGLALTSAQRLRHQQATLHSAVAL